MKSASVPVCLLLVLCVGCDVPPPPSAGGHRVPRDWREHGEGPHGTPQHGTGPGGRPQKLLLSPRDELALGRQSYREVLSEYRGKVLPRESPPVQHAREVVRRLANAAAIEPLQREINLLVRDYAFEWEVNVVEDPQANAFCLPAGKMVVFTGLLRITRDSDDFLATVLSHEMAHALAHHANERVALSRSSAGKMQTLAYGRSQEWEADRIGVFLMPFAGYDPRKAAAFWQRMHDARGGREPPEILSSHPSDEHRIATIREAAPKAIAAYQQYKRKQNAPE